MKVDPIDPHQLLEQLTLRQEETAAIRARVVELTGNPASLQTAQALALLYVGDRISELTTQLMLPYIQFKE